jgi:dTDP-4-amino-4,6-dideoxygalactose transaminase
MSPVAQWIRRQIDLAAVTQRRQENYRWLKAALKSVKGARPVFGDLEPSGAPLGFPIIVEQRDAVRLKLIAGGIDPRPIWSGLPLQVPMAGFADARYVAAHNIVLPVHQDLRPNALAHIVSALERAITTSS